MDAIGDQTGMLSGALLGTLLDLELRGLAEALPGKRYRRC